MSYKRLLETTDVRNGRRLDLEPSGQTSTQLRGFTPIVGLEPTTLGLTVPRSTS